MTTLPYRRLHLVLWLGGLCAAVRVPAEAQVLRVVANDQTLAREEAFTARGYPAFPLTLLAPLGAEIRSERGTVIVTLFGDTLRFRSGQAVFWADARVEPLYSWSFEKDEVLFVAQRFFTQWLPRRYADRITYADSTLQLTAGPAGVLSDGATPAPTRATSGIATAPARAPAATAREPAAAERDPEPFYGSLLGFIDARVSGVYDSNIDHTPVPRPSYATESRLLVGMQSARSRPFFFARYDLGLYQFANSERWNRATHDVSAEIAPAVDRVRLRLAAAIRVGSWTEDRELANQIALRPQLEVRVTNTKTLNLYVAQRSRRVGSGTDTRSDTNRIAGAWFNQWWRGGGFLIDGRYEHNASERASSRFEGWFAYSTLRVPVGSVHRVSLRVSHAWRRYPQSFPGAGAEAREDRRWTAGVLLSREFGRGAWELGTGYEIEQNRSNDPLAGYVAQRIELTVRRRW